MPKLVLRHVSQASPAVGAAGGFAQISVAHAVWQPPAPVPQSHVRIAWSKTPTPAWWLFAQQVTQVDGFARQAASPVAESGGPLSKVVLPVHAESAVICELHALELLTTVAPLQVKSDAV